MISKTRLIAFCALLLLPFGMLCHAQTDTIIADIYLNHMFDADIQSDELKCDIDGLSFTISIGDGTVAPSYKRDTDMGVLTVNTNNKIYISADPGITFLRVEPMIVPGSGYRPDIKIFGDDGKIMSSLWEGRSQNATISFVSPIKLKRFKIRYETDNSVKNTTSLSADVTEIKASGRTSCEAVVVMDVSDDNGIEYFMVVADDNTTGEALDSCRVNKPDDVAGQSTYSFSVSVNINNLNDCSTTGIDIYVAGIEADGSRTLSDKVSAEVNTEAFAPEEPSEDALALTINNIRPAARAACIVDFTLDVRDVDSYDSFVLHAVNAANSAECDSFAFTKDTFAEATMADAADSDSDSDVHSIHGTARIGGINNRDVTPLSFRVTAMRSDGSTTESNATEPLDVDTSSVTGIDDISQDAGASEPQYFDLAGRRVGTLQSGVYIERRGAVARKVAVAK